MTGIKKLMSANHNLNQSPYVAFARIALVCPSRSFLSNRHERPFGLEVFAIE